VGVVRSRTAQTAADTNGDSIPDRYIFNLASTNICGQRGDSGAPFFRGHKALGILSSARTPTTDGSCMGGYYTGARTIEGLANIKFAPYFGAGLAAFWAQLLRWRRFRCGVRSDPERHRIVGCLEFEALTPVGDPGLRAVRNKPVQPVVLSLELG
jgi:hypothetical protein